MSEKAWEAVFRSNGKQWAIQQGHVIDELRAMPEQSVHCVITSPPYWSLRSYQIPETVWGGRKDCEHDFQTEEVRTEVGGGNWSQACNGRGEIQGLVEDFQEPVAGKQRRGKCSRCGAWIGCLGLEPTIDLFVQNTVLVFREVHRVLRNDGVLWLNIGDIYNSGKAIDWLKPKDLCGIPWRVAMALQQPYMAPTCVESETDRAWLAAIFDGEGCIGIRRFDSYRKEKKQVYKDGFVAYTVVTNSDIELLDRCVTVTRLGSPRLKQAAGAGEDRGVVSRRDSYGWRLDGNSSISVIRAIYPYLIAKRKQACIAYTLDTLNKIGHGRLGVSEEVYEKKKYLWSLIKQCNQRQPVDLPQWIAEPSQEIQPGWYLRSACHWLKRSAMPESVRDRPASAVEHIFLLAKSQRYFYDHHAVRKVSSDRSRARRNSDWWFESLAGPHGMVTASSGEVLGFDVNPEPSKEKHYATFPPKLIQPMIAAGTSEFGCCRTCAAPFARVFEEREPTGDWADKSDMLTTGTNQEGGLKGDAFYESHIPEKPIGWAPTCECKQKKRPDGSYKTDDCIVLDTFGGTGTTVAVAKSMGRRAVAIEINKDYVLRAERRVRRRPAPFKQVEPLPGQRDLFAGLEGSDESKDAANVTAGTSGGDAIGGFVSSNDR